MISWLLSSPIGRLFAKIAAVAAVILGVFVAGRREGKRAGKVKDLKKSLETSDRAREKQDEIRKASPDDVARRLDGWMRDDNEDV